VISSDSVQPIRAEPSDDELRAWDWRADLRRWGRSVPWLARQTERADQTVYQYSRGQTRPSIAWLRSAWVIIQRLNES
jgi:hypothetical protein